MNHIYNFGTLMSLAKELREVGVNVSSSVFEKKDGAEDQLIFFVD
jgi:hypothetical protein